MAFRYLSADAHPDHDTLAEFRKRHLEALAGLFTQALQLCEKAGLVKLGHVSIDGTKIKAHAGVPTDRSSSVGWNAGVPTDRSSSVGWNASKRKAMSYGRMGETEQRLKQEIEALLKQAEATDAAEDAQFGKGRRGDELPEELARRESRLKKIAQAKAELEQEAREKAERERAEAEAKLAERREREGRTGKKMRGREPRVPDPKQAKPEAKAQRRGPRRQVFVAGVESRGPRRQVFVAGVESRGSPATGLRRWGGEQLHRSGKPHHAGRGQQGQLPAGLQRTGGGGFDGAGDRGRGGRAADHR